MQTLHLGSSLLALPNCPTHPRIANLLCPGSNTFPLPLTQHLVFYCTKYLFSIFLPPDDPLEDNKTNESSFAFAAILKSLLMPVINFQVLRIAPHVPPTAGNNLSKIVPQRRRSTVFVHQAPRSLLLDDYWKIVKLRRLGLPEDKQTNEKSSEYKH